MTFDNLVWATAFTTSTYTYTTNVVISISRTSEFQLCTNEERIVENMLNY